MSQKIAHRIAFVSATMVMLALGNFAEASWFHGCRSSGCCSSGCSCGAGCCGTAPVGGCAYQTVQKTIKVPTMVTEMRTVNACEYRTEQRQAHLHGLQSRSRNQDGPISIHGHGSRNADRDGELRPLQDRSPHANLHGEQTSRRDENGSVYLHRFGARDAHANRGVYGLQTGDEHADGGVFRLRSLHRNSAWFARSLQNGANAIQLFRLRRSRALGRTAGSDLRMHVGLRLPSDELVRWLLLALRRMRLRPSLPDLPRVGAELGDAASAMHGDEASHGNRAVRLSSHFVQARNTIPNRASLPYGARDSERASTIHRLRAANANRNARGGRMPMRVGARDGNVQRLRPAHGSTGGAIHCLRAANADVQPRNHRLQMRSRATHGDV